MNKQPVARLGDSGSHGGHIISAKSNILADGIPVATVGDMYACPVHGTNPIVSGMPGSFGTKKLIAHVGSRTACGDVIVTGSPKVFVDLPHGAHSLDGFTRPNLHYVNTCRLCKKDVDGDPLRDASYNRYFEAGKTPYAATGTGTARFGASSIPAITISTRFGDCYASGTLIIRRSGRRGTVFCP